MSPGRLRSSKTSAGRKPSFNALQNRGQQTVFYCFDLLHFAGIDLRRSSYTDRRRYLAQCLLPSPLVQLVHVVRRRRAGATPEPEPA